MMYWEYNDAADSWEFHAPQFGTEVSIAAIRKRTGQLIYVRHKDTTMSPGWQEMIVKLVIMADLFGLVDQGIYRVEIENIEQLTQNAHNVDQFMKIAKIKTIFQHGDHNDVI